MQDPQRNNYQKKIGDTPTDTLQLISRKFATMNGMTTNRPKSSIMGQFYFDTSLATNGKPLWWNGKGWVDATGTFQ